MEYSECDSTVNPQWKAAWFDLIWVVLRGEWKGFRERARTRQTGSKIEKEREIDSSLQGEMIVLGKKQSVLIDFFLLAEWRSIWKSLSAIWSAAVFTHARMDSGAPLKMRINTHSHSQSIDCLFLCFPDLASTFKSKKKHKSSDTLLTYTHTQTYIYMESENENKHK